MLTQQLKEAKEKRAAALETVREHRSRMEAKTWNAEKDGAAFDKATADVEAANVEIRRLEAAIAAGAAAPAEPTTPTPSPVTVNVIAAENRSDKEEDLARRFSIRRAVALVVEGKQLDGAERDVHQVAEKEARDLNISSVMPGNIRIPGFIARNEQRTQTTSGAIGGSATTAGPLVPTELGQIVPFLDPRPVVRQMGAIYLPGLTGDYDEPRDTNNLTATWVGEISAASETESTRDLIQYRPKRLTAKTKMSRLSLVQTGQALEAMERRKLASAIDRALDLAAINGAGGNAPTGLLTAIGAGQIIALGTNGAVPDWSKIVALETKVATGDADLGALGYITTPGIAGLLKTLKRDVAGNGFIWEGPNHPKGMVNGYNAGVSTLVPSTLTKGTASGICHAIIFGDWQNCVIAQWGGVDIIVNPYTDDESAIVKLTIHSYMDVKIRQAASFAAIVDALLS